MVRLTHRLLALLWHFLTIFQVQAICPPLPRSPPWSPIPSTVYQTQQDIAADFNQAFGDRFEVPLNRLRKVYLAGFDHEIFKLRDDVARESVRSEISVTFFLWTHHGFKYITTLLSDYETLKRNINKYHHYFQLKKVYIERFTKKRQWRIDKLIMLPSTFSDDIVFKKYGHPEELAAAVEDPSTVMLPEDVKDKQAAESQPCAELEPKNEESDVLLDIYKEITGENNKKEESSANNDKSVIEISNENREATEDTKKSLEERCDFLEKLKPSTSYINYIASDINPIKLGQIEADNLVKYSEIQANAPIVNDEASYSQIKTGIPLEPIAEKTLERSEISPENPISYSNIQGICNPAAISLEEYSKHMTNQNTNDYYQIESENPVKYSEILEKYNPTAENQMSGKVTGNPFEYRQMPENFNHTILNQVEYKQSVENPIDYSQIQFPNPTKYNTIQTINTERLVNLSECSEIIALKPEKQSNVQVNSYSLAVNQLPYSQSLGKHTNFSQSLVKYTDIQTNSPDLEKTTKYNPIQYNQIQTPLVEYSQHQEETPIEYNQMKSEILPQNNEINTPFKYDEITERPYRPNKILPVEVSHIQIPKSIEYSDTETQNPNPAKYSYKHTQQDLGNIHIQKPLQYSHMPLQNPIGYIHVQTQTPLEYSHIQTGKPAEYSHIQTQKSVEYSNIPTFKRLEYTDIHKQKPVEYTFMQSQKPMPRTSDYNVIETQNPAQYSFIQSKEPIEYNKYQTQKPIAYNDIQTQNPVENNQITVQSPIQYSKIQAANTVEDDAFEKVKSMKYTEILSTDPIKYTEVENFIRPQTFTSTAYTTPDVKLVDYAKPQEVKSMEYIESQIVKPAIYTATQPDKYIQNIGPLMKTTLEHKKSQTIEPSEYIVLQTVKPSEYTELTTVKPIQYAGAQTVNPNEFTGSHIEPPEYIESETAQSIKHTAPQSIESDDYARSQTYIPGSENIKLNTAPEIVKPVMYTGPQKKMYAANTGPETKNYIESQIVTPSEYSGSQTGKPLQYTRYQKDTPLKYTGSQTVTPLEYTGSPTKLLEYIRTQTVNPFEYTGSQTVIPLEYTGSPTKLLEHIKSQTVNPLEYTGSQTGKPLQYTRSQADTPLENTGSQTVSPLEYTGSQTVTPLEYTGSPIKLLEYIRSQSINPLEYTGSQTVAPFEYARSQTVTPFEYSGSQTVIPLAYYGSQSGRPLQYTRSLTDTPLKYTGSLTFKPVEYSLSHTEIPLEYSGAQTVKPLECTASQTEILLENTGAQTVKPLEYTRSQTEIPLECTGAQTVKPLEYTGSQTEIPLEYTRAQTITPLKYIGSQTVTPLEYTGSQTVTPLEYTGSQSVTSLEYNGSQTVTPLEYTGSQTVTPLEYAGSQTVTPLKYTGSQSVSLEYTRSQTVTPLEYTGAQIVKPVEYIEAPPVKPVEYTESETSKLLKYTEPQTMKPEEYSESHIVGLDKHNKPKTVKRVKDTGSSVFKSLEYNNRPGTIKPSDVSDPQTIKPVVYSGFQIVKPLEDTVHQTVKPEQYNDDETLNIINYAGPQTMKTDENTSYQTFKSVLYTEFKTNEPTEYAGYQIVKPIEYTGSQPDKSALNIEPETVKPYQYTRLQTIKPIIYISSQSVQPIENTVPQVDKPVVYTGPQIDKPITYTGLETDNYIINTTPPLLQPIYIFSNTVKPVAHTASQIVTPVEYSEPRTMKPKIFTRPQTYNAVANTATPVVKPYVTLKKDKPVPTAFKSLAHTVEPVQYTEQQTLKPLEHIGNKIVQPIAHTTSQVVKSEDNVVGQTTKLIEYAEAQTVQPVEYEEFQTIRPVRFNMVQPETTIPIEHTRERYLTKTPAELSRIQIESPMKYTGLQTQQYIQNNQIPETPTKYRSSVKNPTEYYQTQVEMVDNFMKYSEAPEKHFNYHQSAGKLSDIVENPIVYDQSQIGFPNKLADEYQQVAELPNAYKKIKSQFQPNGYYVLSENTIEYKKSLNQRFENLNEYSVAPKEQDVFRQKAENPTDISEITPGKLIGYQQKGEPIKYTQPSNFIQYNQKTNNQQYYRLAENPTVSSQLQIKEKNIPRPIVEDSIQFEAVNPLEFNQTPKEYIQGIINMNKYVHIPNEPIQYMQVTDKPVTYNDVEIKPVEYRMELENLDKYAKQMQQSIAYENDYAQMPIEQEIQNMEQYIHIPNTTIHNIQEANRPDPCNKKEEKSVAPPKLYSQVSIEPIVNSTSIYNQIEYTQPPITTMNYNECNYIIENVNQYGYNKQVQGPHKQSYEVDKVIDYNQPPTEQLTECYKIKLITNEPSKITEHPVLFGQVPKNLPIERDQPSVKITDSCSPVKNSIEYINRPLEYNKQSVKPIEYRQLAMKVVEDRQPKITADINIPVAQIAYTNSEQVLNPFKYTQTSSKLVENPINYCQQVQIPTTFNYMEDQQAELGQLPIKSVESSPPIGQTIEYKQPVAKLVQYDQVAAKQAEYEAMTGNLEHNQLAVSTIELTQQENIDEKTLPTYKAIEYSDLREKANQYNQQLEKPMVCSNIADNFIEYRQLVPQNPNEYRHLPATHIDYNQLVENPIVHNVAKTVKYSQPAVKVVKHDQPIAAKYIEPVAKTIDYDQFIERPNQLSEIIENRKDYLQNQINNCENVIYNYQEVNKPIEYSPTCKQPMHYYKYQLNPVETSQVAENPIAHNEPKYKMYNEQQFNDVTEKPIEYGQEAVNPIKMYEDVFDIPDRQFQYPIRVDDNIGPADSYRQLKENYNGNNNFSPQIDTSNAEFGLPEEKIIFAPSQLIRYPGSPVTYTGESHSHDVLEPYLPENKVNSVSNNDLKIPYYASKLDTGNNNQINVPCTNYKPSFYTGMNNYINGFVKPAVNLYTNICNQYPSNYNFFENHMQQQYKVINNLNVVPIPNNEYKPVVNKITYTELNNNVSPLSIIPSYSQSQYSDMQIPNFKLFTYMTPNLVKTYTSPKPKNAWLNKYSNYIPYTNKFGFSNPYTSMGKTNIDINFMKEKPHEKHEFHPSVINNGEVSSTLKQYYKIYKPNKSIAVQQIMNSVNSVPCILQNDKDKSAPSSIFSNNDMDLNKLQISNSEFLTNIKTPQFAHLKPNTNIESIYAYDNPSMVDQYNIFNSMKYFTKNMPETLNFNKPIQYESVIHNKPVVYKPQFSYYTPCKSHTNGIYKSPSESSYSMPTRVSYYPSTPMTTRTVDVDTSDAASQKLTKSPDLSYNETPTPTKPSYSYFTSDTTNPNLKLLTNNIKASIKDWLKTYPTNIKSIPIGEFGLATFDKGDNRFCIIKTDDPNIIIQTWTGKAKVVKAVLTLETEEVSVTNFLPEIVRGDYDPKAVQYMVKDVIKKMYGEPIVIETTQFYKPYVEVGNTDTLKSGRCTILWPTYDRKLNCWTA